MPAVSRLLELFQVVRFSVLTRNQTLGNGVEKLAGLRTTPKLATERRQVLADDLMGNEIP